MTAAVRAVPAHAAAGSVEPEIDLVNAALLGTDRRPLPGSGGDPARTLLERAARRRAEALVVAGTERVEPGRADPPPPALPAPPRAARELLEDCLRRPLATWVNLWLTAAVAHGAGLAPEHWTPVLDRARRQPDLDRRLLAAALGERGRWFAGHNPAWEGVLRSLPVADRRPADRRPADRRPGGDVAAPPAGSGVVDLERLRRDPDRLLAVPDPWPEPVCRTALDLVAEGALPWRAAQAYGAAVGARLPLSAHPLVEEAARRHLDDASPAPHARPWVASIAPPPSGRAGLTALDDVVWTRLLLDHAFDPSRPLPARRPFPSP